MQTEETRAVVTQIYEAATRLDVAAVLACMADDIILTQAPGLPFGGRWQGIDAVRAALQRQFQRTQSRGVLVHHVVADGDRAVGLITSRGIDAAGAPYEMPVAETFRLQDGKIVEIAPYYWDTAAMPELREAPAADEAAKQP